VIHPLLLLAATLAPGQADDGEVQDVLYLGSGKPTVIRLRVTVAGKPVQARWDEVMERLFAYLDANKSGGLDRAEASRAFAPAQLAQFFQGNALTPRSGGRPSVPTAPPFEQMDANRDGKVTADELKAYYAANGCGPLLVNAPNIGDRRAAGVDAASDRLFSLLDTDGDGKLSRAELQAAERLLAHDENDDELVSAGELGAGRGVAGVPGGGGMMPPPRGGSASLSSLLLAPAEPGPRKRPACLRMAREILGRIDRKKAGSIAKSDLPLSDTAFEEIDRNRDGKIDATELARVLSLAPAGEFQVRIGGTAATGKGERRPELLALMAGSARITVVAGPATREYGDSGLLEFLMGYFRAADSEKRGFITRAQLSGEGRFALAGIFDAADRNRDGRLSEGEVRAYVEVVDGARGAQLTLALVESGRGLFQAIDANRDGYLSVRELRTAWARLSDVVNPRDGQLSRDDIPSQVTLHVGAGTAAPAFGMQQPRRVAPDRGPLWFRKMDRNGDGDLSLSEWLGSKAEFDLIDTDRDGLISLDEAEAHDQRSRKK
jgi:Ca2+-binding EF-hand superfamily protein